MAVVSPVLKDKFMQEVRVIIADAWDSAGRAELIRSTAETMASQALHLPADEVERRVRAHLKQTAGEVNPSDRSAVEDTIVLAAQRANASNAPSVNSPQ